MKIAGLVREFVLKSHPERAQPIGQPVAKLATLEKRKNTNQTVCRVRDRI